MTKEHAIKILEVLPNSIVGITLPFDIDFDYTEAINMAIKELEQETVSKDIYTKTDIAAILTELQLEIGYEAWTTEYPDGSHKTIIDIESVSKIIQQKIDKYKTETGTQEYELEMSEEKKSDDCVSRKATLDEIKSMPNVNPTYWINSDVVDRDDLINNMQSLSPVTPIHGTCKNCRHRDPEDRKCDCGHDIVWQLPRPDDWYCKDFEKRGNDNDK